MIQKENVRVRIAPSPTGDPHVGTAYVALYNYVFAKQHNGQFILRIEDTDRTRFKPTSEIQIYESLRWLGLKWDEGPDIGGNYGPYRQSQRIEIYNQYVQLLLNNGSAYRCFCSPERLQKLREQQKGKNKITGYDKFCLNLSPQEIEKNLRNNVPYVVRMNVPRNAVTVVKDELRGEVHFNNDQLDDQILLKSDGFPTYHLANVVDDYLMKITHVIRAEEWLPSTPKHVLLYKAFGWEQPKWIHMPLLRNADKSKISKRKNPVSLIFYKKAGFLPQAVLNFLALMGWNPGNNVEIFSLDEMIKNFNIRDINLGGPIFDLDKLLWLNRHYIQQLSQTEFANYIKNEILNDHYLNQIIPLIAPRISRFDEFFDKAYFFFVGSLNYKNLNLIIKDKTKDETIKILNEFLENLDELYDWEYNALNTLLEKHRESLELKPKDYYMCLRLSIIGRADSPPLIDTIFILGKEVVKSRIKGAIDYLKKLKHT